MVNVDLYSAIITKVSNALNTLVSGVYTYYHIHASTSVGFVAAAVSMSTGGCRARRSLVGDVVSVTVEPAVL